jgi:hypothetical protein
MKAALRRALPVLLGLAATALAQEDVVMKAMRDELARSMSQLRLEKLDKPYFIAYETVDTTTAAVSATLGQLTASDFGRSRMFTARIRVGDYQLDNTNFFTGPGGGAQVSALPLDDDYNQIRRGIWLATDAGYKRAGATLAAKRSALERRKTPPALPDFTRQPPVKVNEPAVAVKIDVPALENLARQLSAVFRDSPEILGSSAQVSVANAYDRMVNSEGTSSTVGRPRVELRVSARTQAADGSPIEDSFNLFGRSLDVLRGDELLARSRALLARLRALRAAPLLDRYNGPVLFENEAAGEVVAQVFAPAVMAVRIPMSPNQQFENQMRQVMDQFGFSLADRLGGRVMPDGFDLTDNPLAREAAGVPLVDTHSIDSEGVPTREVKLVESGILKALLATRTPTAQTTASTGSAGVSGSPGGATPSNLFLTSRQPKTAAELRQELLRLAKQRGNAYGIVVRKVGFGGLSALLRLAMNSVSPGSAGSMIAAYKVFEDGHEELVRAQIAPVQVTAFKDIVAAGDKPGVYNIASFSLMSSLGSATPGVSVASYVVPPLLFDDISLKRPEGPSPTPPVAPSPIAAESK